MCFNIYLNLIYCGYEMLEMGSGKVMHRHKTSLNMLNISTTEFERTGTSNTTQFESSRRITEICGLEIWLRIRGGIAWLLLVEERTQA